MAVDTLGRSCRFLWPKCLNLTLLTHLYTIIWFGRAGISAISTRAVRFSLIIEMKLLQKTHHMFAVRILFFAHVS